MRDTVILSASADHGRAVAGLAWRRSHHLFLNTGHGTLGWTMACGSGKLVCDIVTGHRPDISTDGLAIARYARNARCRPTRTFSATT